MKGTSSKNRKNFEITKKALSQNVFYILRQRRFVVL